MSVGDASRLKHLTTGRGVQVSLFRAVSTREAADIAATGQLRAVGGAYEGKLFAKSLDDARTFGNALYPGGQYAIVEVKVPAAFVDELVIFYDSGVGRFAASVDRTQLERLNGVATHIVVR